MDHNIDIPIDKGVNFTHIKRDNFNTSKISVHIFLPLEEKTASKNAILPKLLTRKCKKFPDFLSFNKKLSDLYALDFSSSISKFGDIQVLEISAEFLKDHFAIFEESISKEASKLFCEVLFRPYIVNGGFDYKDFEQEKRQLIELLDSEYNDKRLYAFQRALKIMFSNEAYSVNHLGNKENIENLDRFDVYNNFKKILEKAKIKITLISSEDSSKIVSIFKNEFSKIKRQDTFKLENTTTHNVEKQKFKKESQEIKQSKLVMGFRTPISFLSEDFFKAVLACAIFGSTSHSKLFLNVREKKSLCYYCSSNYDKNKGVMFVQSGVEESNIENAKSEILNQLEEMKNGNISEEEMLSTKLSIKNSLTSYYDSMGQLSEFLSSQFLLSKKYTPREFIEKINEINKEQIIETSKTFKLDTIFSLVPKK